MCENLKHVENDEDFEVHLKEAGNKLVVVDVYADWCSHCQAMGTVFECLAQKYPLAIFLKVNVDECADTAISLNVKCLPSFFFFREGKKVDGYCGGDAAMLEDKIKKLYKGNHTTGTGNQVSLTSFIDIGKSGCLNECQEHVLKNALTAHGYLESDSSSKLIITIVFTELVNVQSLKIHGPSDCGPKTMKLFINNKTEIFEFKDVEKLEASQTLELTMGDLEMSATVPLCRSKFQDVNSLTIFVTENQAFSNKTQINRLTFFGSLAKYGGHGGDGLD